MRIMLSVTVELTRREGKFASKDEVAEALRQLIADNDPGEVDGVGADGETAYDIDSFDVEVLDTMHRSEGK